MIFLKTKRQIFLEEMEKAIPWGTFSEILNKHYKKTSATGRPKKELILMLKFYFLQQWYNLGDREVEEFVADSKAFRDFTGLDMIPLDNGDFFVDCPDETTILRFRHFLEKSELQEKLFNRVNKIFKDKGYIHKEGTIVDSTIIKASSSTKNKDKKRDKDMKSTKKNNNFFFGAKSHIGVDAISGLIHSLEFTSANVSDKSMLFNCLHGKEKYLFGDKGYIGKEDKKQWRKQGKIWCILDKGTKSKKLSKSQEKRNKKLSSVRSKVEHPFKIIKHQWKHKQVRYKGLTKNKTQWFILCMLHNIYKMRKKLIINPI
jgi:IS5 family transposase